MIFFVPAVLQLTGHFSCCHAESAPTVIDCN